MIDIKSAYSDVDYSFSESFSLGLAGYAIDDRSRYSVDFLKRQCVKTISLQYRKESLDLLVNDEVLECHELSDYFGGMNLSSILLDSTSLDIPELSLALKALHKISGLKVVIVYVEPGEYASGAGKTLDHEEFALSDEISGFEGTGIPTISMPVDSELSRRFIFFVGFEGGRLQNAIETYDISSDEARIYFGLPAFRPGWEVKSIRRNLQALNDQSFSSRIGYCSASSCTDALRSLYKAMASGDGVINYIVPLGTKPNSIAAILLMLENPDSTRLLYDQPHKRSERSRGVGRRHYYHYMVP
ncbi:hypothetical protein [Azotobacter vinelandii]|uniref:hypothetical protein n=1 Tax=Azotobacter vinelandii TaxID=354 RepID=UPI000B1A7CDF|nr:hypothetical protein [Azotobacter vinelandii]